MNEEDQKILEEFKSNVFRSVILYLNSLWGALGTGAAAFLGIVWFDPTFELTATKIWIAFKISMAPGLLGAGLLARQKPQSKEQPTSTEKSTGQSQDTNTR